MKNATPFNLAQPYTAMCLLPVRHLLVFQDSSGYATLSSLTGAGRQSGAFILGLESIPGFSAVHTLSSFPLLFGVLFLALRAGLCTAIPSVNLKFYLNHSKL